MEGIRFDNDWRAWGPGVLEAALWLVLAVNAARLAWWLLVSPTPPETDFMPSAVSAPATWPDRDPFYPAAGPASGVAPASLAGYTLHSVRHADASAGARAGRASAIIGDPDGRQRAFRVGGTVSPGVVLQAVGPAHAMLSANGGRHRLDLPDAIPAPAARRAPRPALPAAPGS